MKETVIFGGLLLILLAITFSGLRGAISAPLCLVVGFVWTFGLTRWWPKGRR